MVICIAKNFILTTLKVIFSIFFFLHLLYSIYLNSCISAKYCPILTYIRVWKDYLFSFQMMFKSYPYVWFWDPGSHIRVGLSKMHDIMNFRRAVKGIARPKTCFCGTQRILRKLVNNLFWLPLYG